MTDSAHVEYSEKVVAFLDILGFRQLILESRDHASAVIANLETALAQSLENLALEGGPDWVSVKLFSDCFCLSCTDENSNLFLMLSEVSFLQFFLATSDIFVRGGLSIGAHYESDRMIFSEGLVRAYDTQAHDPFPRVIVDRLLVARIEAETNQEYRDSLLPYLQRDEAGMVFLNYLRALEELDVYTGNMDECLEGHKVAIVKQAKQNQRHLGVLAKYRWLKDYHNRTCERFIEDQAYIESYLPEIRSRLLIPESVFS